MLARQPGETPGDQQHHHRGKGEDERDHPSHMLGRLLGVEVHGQGGSHARHSHSDGSQGADSRDEPHRSSGGIGAIGHRFFRSEHDEADASKP